MFRPLDVTAAFASGVTRHRNKSGALGGAADRHTRSAFGLRWHEDRSRFFGDKTSGCKGVFVRGNEKIRIIIANNLALIRHGIRALLSGVEGIEIVGEVATTDETLRLAKELSPDVVLLDEDVVGDSPGSIRDIKQTTPGLEIIVMADSLNEAKALKAVEAGAVGYVGKDIPIINLVAALRSVHNGRAFFHPETAEKLMERLGHLTRGQLQRLRLESDGLTAREMDILLELAKGGTDREIAAKLVLAEGTVKTHIRHILHKLGVRNRTQAVAHVLRKGVIR